MTLHSFVCISIACMLAGCSNNATPVPGPPESSGGSSAPTSTAGSTTPMAAGAPSRPAQAGAQAQATKTPMSTGGAGGTPSAGMMSMPDGSAGSAGSAPMNMRDCTAVAWDNPGKVGSVSLSEIPANAGKKMRPFESIEALKNYDYEWKEFLFTSTSPAYTTRLFVKKPRDPAKFSGTVFVEWYNVSGGIDFAVLWANSQDYFMREGHAFIAVSAQAGGANALKSMVDADRYAKIDHPGDNIANTVFSQAGAAIRTQTEALLGPCMPVHAVIAGGQSQSGLRLADYLNNAQAKDKVYDGLLIHSGQEPASNNPAIPTFVVFTMSEGNGKLKDGPNMVEWMIAGATHNDKHVTDQGKEVAEVIGVPVTECQNPMNDFPSYRVYNAVLDGLNKWVREQKRPPAGMPFQMSGSQLATDANKNVLGGVRSPDIEVPIATHGFDNGPKDPTDVIGLLACGLGGEEIPFTPAQLMQLYPTHDDYVSKYTMAADRAVMNGLWVQADRDEAVKLAQAAPIPQ